MTEGQLQEGVAAIRRGEGEKIDGDYPRDIFPLASELNLLIASNKEIVELEFPSPRSVGSLGLTVGSMDFNLKVIATPWSAPD